MPDEENPLAPLSLSILKRIQRLQSATRRALKHCSFHGTKQLDDRSALETLRSHLIAEIDLRLGFYEAVPGYEWDWNTEILSHATASALACFPLDWFEQRDEARQLVGYEGNKQFMKALVSTGWEYAVTRRLAKGNLQSARPIPMERNAARLIGEQIKELRLESRMTEEKLAEAIGKGKRTVQRHISGELKPRISTVGLYEKAFSKALKRSVKIETPS